MKSDSPQDQPWPVPYERPNQKWLCGRTDKIFPCPLGPDGHGRCQTTSECSPALEKKAGDEKGRYRCTRRAEYGGPCDEGPLPSGACSHAAPPCAPIRSMRKRRALFTYWILGLTVAALLLIFHGGSRYKFVNPGPVSTAHSQPKSGPDAKKRAQTENCSACHRTAGDGLRTWVEAAAGADPHPFHFAGFVQPSTATPTRMDGSCSECHREHQFHHVNMKQDQSCLRCHQEHRGDLGLKVRSDQRCVDCHGSTKRMDEASDGLFTMATDGKGMARPSAPITRFSRDHPEFGPIATKMSDPNTLRFNHQKHLSNPVVGADGNLLQCTACHQEDAAGEYHRRIRFEQHCQSCHSLQFDTQAPDLPHGDVAFVHAYLGSLPQQFETFAQQAGITGKRELQAFVEKQMKRVQEQQVSGATLEDDVFLSRSRRIGPNGRKVPFYGCAYCHEVTGRGSAVKVVKAEVPLRWLTKGAFHHREHQNISCVLCHNAAQSSTTSDILLPSVRTCANCHRSSAAPGESCMLCHNFHHWRAN